jgi:uncharacterized membrane protein YjfL (UPF0719 family)
MAEPPREVSREPTTVSRGPRWLARAGFLLALALLLPLSLRPALSLEANDTARFGALVFTVSGLLALWLATAAWNRALLRGRGRAAIERGNLAAGIAAFAHWLGAGIVASHCFAADEVGNLPVSVVFFLVAEIALVLLSLVFRALTDYADDQEILGENRAAAVSYAGVVVALSLIVGHAAGGAFLGWWPALRGFLVFLLWAGLLYPVRQVLVARWLLGLPLAWRGGALDHAIAREHDVVAACVEAAGYLAAALLATGLS